MVILSKACKPDNLGLHNSLKLSFTKIQGLHLNFVDCKSFFESNSLDILVLCKTNLNDSMDSGNFSVRGYVPLIQNDSSTHAQSSSLCKKLRFLSKKKNSRFLLMFLTGFTSLSVLLLCLSQMSMSTVSFLAQLDSGILCLQNAFL